jgi:CRP-like cAMP-binding protein
VKKGDISVAVFQTPGEVFGEMSALEVDTRSATVISEKQGVCFSMDLSIVNNLKNDTIRFKIQDGIQRLKSERLTLTTEKLVA